ncbi:MAG TPA: hypothetical protein VMY18_03895, partial [Acidobacteriota bacterium]|nr:hypothetical protein [Acidobacteriota bacterium]
ESDGLHACWHYVNDTDGLGRWVRYARSLDSGDNWSITTIDTAEAGSQELRMPFPALAVSGGAVHVVWAGGGTINVGRRHRFSIDRGETWSPVSQVFGDLHGQANGDGLVIDHQGRLNFVGQIRWPRGIYRSIWEDGRWSPPRVLYLISKDWQDPLGDRVHAHGIRVASSDNQLVSTLTTAPGIDPSINLYAMNTRRPTLYFPHYGVGSGLSTVFSFSNPSDSYITGTLKTFDPQGNPQELLFESGPASDLNIELPAKSTRVLVARNLDGRLLSGYAKFETDGTDAIGLSIFKYDSGLEAAILPVRPNRRFALFAEETDQVSTGIALLRLSPKPVQMRLYDLNGALVGAEELELTGNQRAVFLKEIFTLPADFQGQLILESEGDYCPIGLRFGRNVLSTLEVADLDSLGASTSLLQYGEQPGFADALNK